LAKNPQTKDDALEALDFIVNVLKEHEHDLDKLINDLSTVTAQIGDTGALSGKVEKIEEKINKLQTEVTNLIGHLSAGSKEQQMTISKEQTTQVQPVQTATAVQSMQMQGAISVILHCKQWEDFQGLAVHAQTMSFSYKEEEKVFQVDALKGNQMISYSGALPKLSLLLKASLSKQFDVAENNILEGVLAIG